MKNYIKSFSLILFIFASYNGNAQLRIGPKVGMNFAKYGGSDVNSEFIKSVLGTQFGLATQFRFNETFAVQPEILYFQKGVKYVFTDLGEDFNTKQYLNYIEIPIIAKIMFFAQESSQLFVSVGPSFGLGLNGKSVSTNFNESFSFNEANLKRLDVSLSIGGGIQSPIGPGKMCLDVRYLFGFNTIDNSAFASSVKNRGIGIGLSYLFALGENKR